MPINTNLNIAPYFDDFDVEKQFYKILFKPGYAVQARELTQLQTILQNQVEQFGDNIYQEGTVIKGCNFTTLNGLEFVKLVDKTGFDVEQYVSGQETAIINGVETLVDVIYEIENGAGLKANIIAATRGFETRPPDLNTFFINYLNTINEGSLPETFAPGDTLTITKTVYNGALLVPELQEGGSGADWTISVSQFAPVGKSFGIRASAGVIFQKGHFLFTEDQTLIVAKYTNLPDNLSVGYQVAETLVSSLQDNSLYDNANGSQNENAPGADRLKMVPKLVVKTTTEADIDSVFFTLIRYQNGNAVTLRDVAQFNSIADEMAKRTYEESGNYILDSFKIDLDRRNNKLTALVGKGTAYVKGYRVENTGKLDFEIDNVSNTATQSSENQATGVNYGSYLDIISIQGQIGMDYEMVELRNVLDAKIGEAFVRNITPEKIYLFGVKMDGANPFIDVERVKGPTGYVTVAQNSKVKGIVNNPSIFDTGTPYTKEYTNMAISVREKRSATITNNVISLTAGINEDYSLDQDDLLVVDNSNVKINIVSFTRSLNNSVMDITLSPGAVSPVAVYLNKRIVAAEPHVKDIVRPYVKTVFQTNKTQYSLGFPDVYKIISINTGAGTTDLTDSFALKTNQQDTHYGISYMEHIPGRPLPTNGQTLIIRLGVFQTNTTQGQYFFNINSYRGVIDDDIENLPADQIRSSDLEVYRGSNGKDYILRNCFDFRPHATPDPVVSYAHTTASAAGTIVNNVGALALGFPGSHALPSLDSTITSNVESYLARMDIITFDSYGKGQIIKGEEELNPVEPSVDVDNIIVAKILVPGFPALTPKEASDSGKFACAVQIKPVGTKNYTMEDIESIENRVQSLEYYVSLNQLEQDTENLTVLDENGLSRFKNGFIVDPMNDVNIANTDDPQYKAAIHFDKRVMTPALNTFPLDLKYVSSSSASIFPSASSPEIATLSRNANVQLLSQPYATNFRNCVSNFWKYDGNPQISPSHDMAHDTIENPTPIGLDIAGIFQDLQQILPMTGTVFEGPIIEGASSSTSSFDPTRRLLTTTTVTPRTQMGRTLNVGVNSSPENAVGDFVTNVTMQPFMRSRNIRVFVSGLRPSTKHYFFFDGENVDANVAPGLVNAMDARDIMPVGARGTAVSTDANGILRAVFTIPQGKFYVGDRVLTVVDVEQYSSIESASTSKADITYHAYNITQSKTTLTTRMPEFTLSETATSRNLANRISVTTRAHDPLAQTFFIKKGMGRGSNSVFISKVDLFFKRKSLINGVTITLREVINGYPSAIILPFSKTHLAPGEVNTSDDASLVTEINFDSPIRMDVEKEYAVVVEPDANDPNYLIFTSKVGNDDLTPGPTQGGAVVMDWGDGILFTSTNNRAWQSVQDEDIKFNLYRHDFNANSGTVTLTNKEHEFFTLSDWDGRFIAGEFVYKQINVGYAVSMIQGQSTITQSGNDFTADYVAGDYILVINSANTAKDIFRIVSVDSPLSITTDKPCYFDGASASGIPIVAGEITHYNKRTASEMHIRNSSATSAKPFSANNVVIGLQSGTEGTIGTIDNINLSYVQPLIQKANDSVTTTSLTSQLTNPTTTTAYNQPMKFGDSNFFTQNGVVVYSKSNNFINPKPFSITVNMANAANATSSPIVDLELATLLAYQFKITNDSASTSKYISKTVELAEDLDAEDMNVFVTAFRPKGTSIKVYIKPQHANDSAAFETSPWIELEIVEGKNTFSSTSNQSDYKEFKYAVAAANKNASSVLEYTGTNGVFESYRKFAIKIEMMSDNIHNSPIVKDYRGIALT